MFSRRRYGHSTMREIGLKIVMFFGILCILTAVCSTGYLLFHPELFEKLWLVMIHNMNFWVIMIVGVCYGGYRKLKNSVEFTWFELPIQLIIGIIVTIGCFGAFLYWSSGLQDSEIWNGKVNFAEYYEKWTEEVHYTDEECTGSGDSRSCIQVPKVRYDYHPPYWEIVTSNNETISISSRTYNQYVSRFGNELEVDIMRMNQSSFGDGDKYVTKWNGNIDLIVPTSISHEYVNYLKASKSLHKRSGTIDVYKQHLLSYPTVTGGKFGTIEFQRVISAGVTIPESWKQTVDKSLDKVLANLGVQKQVNIIVYFVNADRGFLHALEENWIYGKKNDVVLVIGMNSFPKVKWSGVMIFHGNETLKVKLRDEVEAIGDISDSNTFVNMLVNNINKHFIRVPMSKLEHLLYDIEMPIWAIIAVWIMVGTVVFTTSYYLENN